MNLNTITAREYLSKLGAKGGKSKSKAKVDAARRNGKKHKAKEASK